jgi:choline dehydrogenase-like flavoprotein
MSGAYDVIVIGSGAGGGTLVHRLAPSGKRILLLERGDWLRREPQNWLADDVFVDGRYQTADTWYYGDGSSFAPQVHYFVGGATKLYGAALYRLRREDGVTLTREGDIQIAYTASNQEPKERLYHQLHSMLGDLGMHHGHLLPHHAYLKNDIPVAGVAHQGGTCRFGSDPATSVLNTDCRAHEVDNLYVVDTSFFPSIGAVNPALTAMANALRVGDHLLERIGSGVPTEAAHVS